MTQQEFSRLVKPDTYQVFLFTCPATLFFFARHPWFVINNNGNLTRYGVGSGTRWEVYTQKNQKDIVSGHLFTDALPPTAGLVIFPLTPWRFASTLSAYLEGGQGSVAQRMADFISETRDTYPLKDRYWITGPNSNTYAQWVINHFPEANFTLPWNAIGKGKARKAAAVY